MNEQQWKLTVPLSAIAVVLVASDTAVEAHVTKNPSTASHFSTFSNAGLAAMAGSGRWHVSVGCARQE